MDSNSTLVLLLEKRALLNSVFDYETSDSYYTNLFALSALLLVSLALVVFSLVCRKQTPNSLWLFRRESTRYGTIYQWHSLIGWLYCSAIFIFSAVPYIWVTRGNGSAGFTVRNAFPFRTMIFFPLFVGGWFMAVSTLLAPASLIPPASALDNPSRKGRFSLPSPTNILHHPKYLAAFSIFVPVALFVALAPLVILGTIGFDKSWDAYRTMDGLMGDAIAVLRNPKGTGLTGEMILGLLLAEQKVQDTGHELIVAWESVWCVYATFVVIELVVFIFASTVYFGRLRGAMKEIRESQSTSTVYLSVVIPPSIISPTPYSSTSDLSTTRCDTDSDETTKKESANGCVDNRSDGTITPTKEKNLAVRRKSLRAGTGRLMSLRGAYRGLVVTTGITVLMEGLYLIVACVLAFHSKAIAETPGLSTSIALGAIYIYAIFGTLTNLVVAYRSYQLYRSTVIRPRSLALPTRAPSNRRQAGEISEDDSSIFHSAQSFDSVSTTTIGDTRDGDRTKGETRSHVRVTRETETVIDYGKE